MLQYISKYRKLNENLIVNDFGKPYIVIDTACDSRFRSISILFHLVLSLVVVGVMVFTFYLASFEKKQSQRLENCLQDKQ